ncbi:uncharacterized protein Z518_11202 [Rhinocladiella mackenziei CBS 650.93]|uniref:Rhinocladiella mackenziei CBS 650.93 unplaced genomic scaffold supercont1.12, whole genome shotgun sequence n=1 Tax=Rhinocladiella mackenziei CBS 650.93 TaxID=1442369 RepID=A0A0D2I193_9EURO|nr:uncharacterized protein Z518_11202 [Rhinocladiella mackenziei CBS 650.93]KIW99463.1 hypothetical protein Z518_11202 [Rhinocladiella mackenziei CBS 650.93]
MTGEAGNSDGAVSTSPFSKSEEGLADVDHHEGAMKETAHEAAEDDMAGLSWAFDAAAEIRLRRKIDLYIVPTVAILYLFCFIDRANIGGSLFDSYAVHTLIDASPGNARLAGFEQDLGLSGYDYNQALSVFYISYIIFEIPSNIACKWIGPGWFLPALTLGFGIATVAFAFVETLEAACGVRFILEAGMLPGIAYYMSRCFGDRHRWQMIFALEGIVTIFLALVSFFTLTDRPETARWLIQEEKELAISRVKSERVGATEVLDKFNSKKAWRGIWNPVTAASSFVFLLGNVTVQGLAFFLPTVVRTIYPDRTVVSNQLHTAPPYIVGGFFILLVNFTSWRFDRRRR